MRQDVETGHGQTFGALLKRHRGAAGLTQEQLAERAGLTAQAIGALERGVRRAPYRDTVRALAVALALAPAEAAAFEASVVRGRSPGIVSRPAAAVLPLAPSTLIGREREVGEVLALLRRPAVRLVTLTGTGGVGKTRLALEVARDVAASGRTTVGFVSLAPLRDPDLVATAVARALGVQERTGLALPDALSAALHDHDVLLVLDNFEHVAPAAPFVARLIATSARLRVLATSRARLHVRGERVYPVLPLTTPDPARLPPLAALASVPAVALLVDRAQAATPDFALDAANAAAVAAICTRLDGLPLALELAATRLTVLAPELLLRRLARQLPLLTGGARDLPERQRTLRATLDWSHALLSPGEQVAFRRLAVFAGGCTFDGASRVVERSRSREEDCESELLDSSAARLLGSITALVEQSLLRREMAADSAGDRVGGPRFAMLETVREYGLERLAASGEERATRRGHAAYFLSLATAAEAGLEGPEQVAWAARLEHERDNLRTALQWICTTGDGAGAQRMAAALWRFWAARPSLSEGRRWLRTALALEDGDEQSNAAARAKALAVAALLAIEQGRLDEAAGLCDEAVTVARDRGERGVLVRALCARGLLARQQGRYADSAEEFEDALALARGIEHRPGIAAALNGLACAASRTGQAGSAALLFEESLTISRDLGDVRGIAGTLNELALHAMYAGGYGRAEGLAEEALDLFRQLGDSGNIAETLWLLGIVAQSRGDYELAEARHEEGLSVRRERGDERSAAQSLNALGAVALNLGDLPRARALLTEALATLRRWDDRWGEALVLALLGHVALAAGELERAAYLLTESAARFDAIGNPLYLPWCLEGLAGVAAARGDWERAARLCGIHDALRERLGSGLPPAEPARFARSLAAMRAALGDDAFTAARAAGEALTPEQALAEPACIGSSKPRVLAHD